MDTWKSCQNSNLFEFKGRNHGFFTFFSASFSVKTPGFQKTGTAAKGKPARRRLFLRALFKRDLRGRAAPIFKHTHCTNNTFPFSISAKKLTIWRILLMFWYLTILQICLAKNLSFLNVMFVYVFTLLKAEKLSCRIWKYQ